MFFHDFLSKSLRFYHTIRFLRFVQIFSRVLQKIKKVHLTSDFSFRIRKATQQFQVFPLSLPHYISKDSFVFLNKRGDIGSWNDNSKNKLWLYNLHYFDDLNAISSQNKNECNNKEFDWLLDKWIDDNPPLNGNGWEPYPISLRVVNWIKYFIRRDIHNYKFFFSLFQQVNVLSQQLEFHLLGNHLFANAKALVFSGCFFSGEQSDKWLLHGLTILDSEIDEQILNDGANFELSPMYHNIILGDMLDLYNLACSFEIPELHSRKQKWRRIIIKMFKWANAMAHPDGDIPFFNDSAFNASPYLSTLNSYATKLGIIWITELDKKNHKKFIVEEFRSSGYISVYNNLIKVILDTARIGPDYIPGHAHADTLSFEMSIFGERVFVNSGTGEYGVSDERLRQRKTAAHNTVEVDGEDSSEVWGGFRVARRAYPSMPFIEQTENTLTVRCSHNGYCRLPGKVTHQRQWDFSDEFLRVTDSLTGQFQKAQAYYHIHPEIIVTVKGRKAFLGLKSGKQVILQASEDILIENTTWHPQFGISIPNKKLVIPFSSDQLEVNIWF